MQQFNYAVMDQDGVKLILVLVNSTFENKNCLEQQELRERLVATTQAQGLSGEVVPVWRGYTGRPKSLPLHPLARLIRGIDWGVITNKISGTVACAF